MPRVKGTDGKIMEVSDADYARLVKSGRIKSNGLMLVQEESSPLVKAEESEPLVPQDESHPL